MSAPSLDPAAGETSAHHIPETELASDRSRWLGRPLAEMRGLLELARLAVDPLFFGGPGLPRGNGRPVVLVPGFLAGDQTLAVLAGWLWRMGYNPRTAGILANVDCSDRALERIERKVAELHRRHDRRVAIVGHSRGGHLARALAARRPDQVSHAVSLGADLRGMVGISTPTLYAVSAARGAMRASGRARDERCLGADCGCSFTREYVAPFPSDRVRMTSIYSKGDGVVMWQGAIVPYAENVEVTGSHVGLVFNRKAYRAIANALASPELVPVHAVSPRRP
jgi:pimeloyl-ACP methyl ester carboxylesterase